MTLEEFWAHIAAGDKIFTHTVVTGEAVEWVFQFKRRLTIFSGRDCDISEGITWQNGVAMSRNAQLHMNPQRMGSLRVATQEEITKHVL